MRLLAGGLMIAALGAGVVGCGGGSGDKSSDTATTGTETNGGTTTSGGEKTTGGETKGGGGAKSVVKVGLLDVALDPKNPKVKTGTVTFQIQNRGTLLHAVKIETPEGPKTSKPLLPTKSDTLKVTFNKPGKYVWYCPIDNHRKIGMKGKITVTGGA
jgi:plastocyanin